MILVTWSLPTSYLQCIEQRAALPWMKYEDADQNEEKEDKAQFETLEEAEALAKEHETEPVYSSSWMVKQKKLESPDLVKRIHGFVSQKPKPVFFLEPGDLVLTTAWSDDFRESADSVCVLRKRPKKVE